MLRLFLNACASWGIFRGQRHTALQTVSKRNDDANTSGSYAGGKKGNQGECYHYGRSTYGSKGQAASTCPMEIREVVVLQVHPLVTDGICCEQEDVVTAELYEQWLQRLNRRFGCNE